eukprot:403368839
MNREYLSRNVNYILEPMMLEVIKNKPDNQAKFMLKYLSDNFGERASLGDRNLLDFLRDETIRLQLLLDKKQEQKRQQQAEDQSQKDDEEEETKTNQGSEHETTEDDEEDYVDDLPLPLINKNKGPRSSVSAEAFGDWNKKEAFEAKVVPKSQETKDKIMTRLGQAFMFSALDEKEKQIVVNAMEERKAVEGEHIITQGEEGDNLYVVESGTLSCFKLFPGNSVETFLKKYMPGESFGELALLYNCPRAATIKADGDAILWSLDRNTFNHIVKDAASKKRDKYEKFLESVKLLQGMDSYERFKLADAFKEHLYKAGEYIIKEGEQGDLFYMIESGDAQATKTLSEGEAPVVVMHYKIGDYFGERALIKNEPRAANVIAKTDCNVVFLDRHSFKRLLGPLEEILKRNMDIYEQFNTE